MVTLKSWSYDDIKPWDGRGNPFSEPLIPPPNPGRDEYVKRLEERVRELENFYSRVKDEIIHLEANTQGPVPK